MLTVHKIEKRIMHESTFRISTDAGDLQDVVAHTLVAVGQALVLALATVHTKLGQGRAVSGPW